MNTTIPEGMKLANQVVETQGSIHGVEVVLFPPFLSLASVKEILHSSFIKLGAQNMHHEDHGAFTGEVSPSMLSSLCQYVILGHSERRHHFSESDDFINCKLKAAVDAGIRPILCVGETLEQRSIGLASDTVSGQLRHCLHGLHNVDTLVIAYEPVWAIGTATAATPETAAEMMGDVIRSVLVELYGSGSAVNVPLLYGGSVTPANIEGFICQEPVHGALVGGASLDALQFMAIVEATRRLKCPW